MPGAEPTPYNPYAPPRAEIAPEAPPGACWRVADHLLMHPTAALPPRCVKCNEPAVTPIKRRTLRWHPPGWYLLAFVNLVLYAIVAAFVRTAVPVAIGLCALHIRSRRRRLWLVWGLLLAGLACFLLCGTGKSAEVLVFPGGLLMLAGLIGSFFCRLLWIRTATKTLVTIEGCGEPFLASLPPPPS